MGMSSPKTKTEAREKIAKALNAPTQDIYFTAGGSESDNWALKAAVEAYKDKGNHIITTEMSQLWRQCQL